MHSLPIFLKVTHRHIMVIGDGEAAAAKRRLLERAGARVVDEGADARLAIVTLEDEAEAEAAVARLKVRGILVNATDRPALCDFTLPAIVDRDPVMIAIGTGGASAGVAKTLRIAIETLLPASLGGLARSLSAARERIRARWPDPADRRRAIDAALAPGGALDRLSESAEEAVDRWIASDSSGKQSELVTITLQSADPDDLTLRQARLLGRADRVYHAANVPNAILDRARADAVRVPGTPPADMPDGLWLHLRFAE